jgi:hypothetical protein
VSVADDWQAARLSVDGAAVDDGVKVGACNCRMKKKKWKSSGVAINCGAMLFAPPCPVSSLRLAWMPRAQDQDKLLIYRHASKPKISHSIKGPSKAVCLKRNTWITTERLIFHR